MINGPGGQPRATRFPMEASVLFRAPGEAGWRQGYSVNISRTGVLVTSDERGLSAEDRAEFVLVLPPVRGGHGATVRCAGRVARVETVANTPECAGAGRFVLTIDEHRFVAGPASDID